MALSIRSPLAPARRRDDSERADTYGAALSKLVPGETLLLFACAHQLPAVRDRPVIVAFVALATLAATPLALRVSLRRGESAHWLQYVARTAVLALFAASSHDTFTEALRAPPWALSAGALVLVLLAAVVLVPPGSQRPPDHLDRRS